MTHFLGLCKFCYTCAQSLVSGFLNKPMWFTSFREREICLEIFFQNADNLSTKTGMAVVSCNNCSVLHCYCRGWNAICNSDNFPQIKSTHVPAKIFTTLLFSPPLRCSGWLFLALVVDQQKYWHTQLVNDRLPLRLDSQPHHHSYRH